MDITKEITGDIFGRIREPFPISNSNYRICVAEKDFKSYYNYYKKTRKEY
jgi:hypothetical protein